MLPKSRKSDYILPLSNNSNCGCKLENMNITKTISSYKGGGGSVEKDLKEVTSVSCQILEVDPKSPGPFSLLSHQ